MLRAFFMCFASPQTLNPYYVLKKRSFFSGLRVDIPEVMSHQVGVYHWKGHRFPMFHMFKTTEIILKGTLAVSSPF